jgi:hypothetical protein
MNEKGFTLLEALVSLGILGITVLNLEPLETPLAAGITLTESFLREARLSAVATTSAHRVSPTASHRLGVEEAAACSASTWTTVTGMNVNLPQGVTFSDTSWSVCFSSRGISADNITIELQHDQFGTRQVEVLLGGTTRIVQ